MLANAQSCRVTDQWPSRPLPWGSPLLPRRVLRGGPPFPALGSTPFLCGRSAMHTCQGPAAATSHSAFKEGVRVLGALRKYSQVWGSFYNGHFASECLCFLILESYCMHLERWGAGLSPMPGERKRRGRETSAPTFPLSPCHLLQQDFLHCLRSGLSHL